MISKMRDFVSFHSRLGSLSRLDPRVLVNSRKRMHILLLVLKVVAIVLTVLLVYHALTEHTFIRYNLFGKDSPFPWTKEPFLLQKIPVFTFTNDLWYTFYQFVEPGKLTIHSNATWFALSLLTREYQTLDSAVRNEHLEDLLLKQLKQENITIGMGGYYSPDGELKPEDCAQINETMAIVIPYRKRAQNLLSFLSYMHRYLPLKAVHYRIVVLEQISVKAFNRAKLFNAGLRELGVLIDEGKRPFVEDVSTRRNCTHFCYVLHDVDKLPVSLKTPYECHTNPQQLLRIAVARNKSATMVGKIPLRKGTLEHWFYDAFFGGVTVVSKRIVQRVNGMSNAFFGWGGEDDDFRQRMYKRHVHVRLTPWNLSRYYVLDHISDSAYNKQVTHLLRDTGIWMRLRQDGIRQTRYTVHNRIVRPLYTLYQISV